MTHNITIVSILFAAIAFSAKSATGCSVMVPMKGTIWKTSEMVTVRWSGINDKSINAITIAQPTAEGGYVDVAKVGTEIPAQVGKHSLKLPANIAPNDNYVIILGNSTDAKCISGSFFIEPGTNATPIVPENPVAAPGNEQKPLPPFPSSSLAVPSNVGTPASSIMANPTTTESSKPSHVLPKESNHHNEVSHAVGHGAVKTEASHVSAASDRNNENLFYVINLLLFITVVIDVMTYL